jgi:hypothetical protein
MLLTSWHFLMYIFFAKVLQMNTHYLSAFHRHSRQFKAHIPYIVESNPHSVFGDFLNRTKLVCGSNPHLSFNCPLPTGWLNNTGWYQCVKSNAMPGANESYWYCEAGLSQQACAMSSETSSRHSCWNVEVAYSNLSCTVVMEEGRQKSKRLSYTAKFKH